MFFPIVWKISGKKFNFPVKTIFLKYVSVNTSNSVSVVLQKLLLKLSYLLGRHLSIQNSQNRVGFLSMSFHLLNFYLKTGRFLAITPPSTEIKEHSKCRQIYQVLMIVGLVMGTMGSMYYYKEAFSDFNFVKIAALVLSEWMLCAFSCRIIVEASRMRGWRRLIKDLKETSCLVQDEEVHTRKVLFKFLGPQIIFWVCCICNVLVRCLCRGNDFYQILLSRNSRNLLTFLLHIIYLHTFGNDPQEISRVEATLRTQIFTKSATFGPDEWPCMLAEQNSRHFQRQLRLLPRSFDLLRHPGEPQLFGFQFASGRI
jgi:hypothetical protein